MPDPQQHVARSSRGLELFRAIGRRIARSEKKNFGDDSSCGSGQESRTTSDSARQEENIERRLSCDESTDVKTKRVSLQVDATDSSSVKTSSTISGDIISSLGNVFRNLQLGGKKKKKKQQKSILRRPVKHVYVRGVSGLPQRVPLTRDHYRRNPTYGASCYY